MTRTANVPAWLGPMLAMAVLFGCGKPDEDTGLDLLPSDELGVDVDTVALRGYTFVDSAVQTSGLTRNLVGSYLDPDFGSVEAGLVTQVRLTTNNVGAGQDNSGLVPDSIVLALVFEVPITHYGNLNAQRFQVFEVTEDLSIDTVYRTDDTPEIAQEELVYPHAGEITPRPFHPPVIDGVTLEPQIRIRLKDALAQRFLAAFGTDDMLDNASFLEFFKGLYIKVDNPMQPPNQGGVLYMNTLSTGSKLTVHYKDQASAEPELARTYDFAINSNCVRYTVVRHDHGQALSSRVMDALQDTVAPAPEVYVQTLGGLRTAVRFPGIEEYLGNGRVLAKAVLVVPVLGTYYPYYPPPAQLFIFRKGEDGQDVFLPDQLSGISGIGGQYESSTNAYEFNITRYIQGLGNGSIPNNGVVLVAGSSGVSANRAILGGPDHAQDPMRLELTFTTY